MSSAKNIDATATIDETFENEFGIYNLSEFLSAYDLLDDPSLEFKDSVVVLSSGKSKIDYRFADESILTFPTKNVRMPDIEFSIKLSKEILSSITKAASVLGHAVCSVHNEGKEILLSVKDPKNTTANTFSTAVGTYEGTSKFDLQIPIANLKLVSGDYIVDFCSKPISLWSHETIPVKYFIALEEKSSFSK
jgi:hypothetical protein